MAKKQIIRLTEGDLHRIVKESVIQILSEGQGFDYLKSVYNDCVKDSYMNDFTFSDFLNYLKNSDNDHTNFIQTGSAFVPSNSTLRAGDYYDPKDPLLSWPSPTKGEKPMKKINKTLYGKIGRALGSAGSFGLVAGKSIYNSLNSNKSKK